MRDRQGAADDATRSGSTWSRLASVVVRFRGDALLAIEDAVFLVVSLGAMLALRYDGALPHHTFADFLTFLPEALLIGIGANFLWGLYGQIWRHASILEARRALLAVLSATTLLLVADLTAGHPLPISVVILGGIGWLTLVSATRFRSRLFAFRRQTETPQGLRVLVIGAGETGAALVRQMQMNRRAGLLPVAFLDDDPRKLHRICQGLPVAGAVSDLVRVADTYGAHQVLLAVRPAPRGLVRRAAEAAGRAGLPLKVLPELGAILNGGNSLSDLRHLRIDDLIGRQQVETDLDAVRELINGRRVLVTGAGGSIGSELVRQIAQWGPAKLAMLDHDETHLHDTAATLRYDADLVLADIRDRDVLMQVFADVRPEVVFHAAAHKHVPLLERHAAEAVRTNIIGTQHLIDAALANDVDRFVFISTDKAVHPTSVMGASKSVAEKLVFDAAAAGGVFCGVRFGNVMGSRGSVIPTFLRQIRNGGPVTVTDARMTRFFMTIPEAVQLVLQAAAMAEGGELFMLEMGEAVRILDLAERMIRLDGKTPGVDVEVRITGTRPGEKLEEELHTPVERPLSTAHPSILRLVHPERDVTPIRWEVERLALLTAKGDGDALRHELFRVADNREPDSVVLPSQEHHDLPDLSVIDLSGSSAWNPSTI